MHRLKLWLFTLTIVAGCTTVGGGSTTPAQAVYAAEGAYAAALTVAVAYGKLPRCGAASPTLCSQQKVVDQIKLADAVAHTAIFSAQSIVRTQGFGQDAIQSAVATATEAARALSLITSTLTVK